MSEETDRINLLSKTAKEHMDLCLELKNQIAQLTKELERVKEDRNRQGVIARSEALKISEGFRAERDQLAAKLETLEEDYTLTKPLIAGLKADKDVLAAKCASLESLHSHALLRIAKLVSREKMLVEALELLMDLQNGPPLLKYKDAWESAMEKAKQALEACQ